MFLQLIPRPPFEVRPLLPDLGPVLKAAYLSGLRDGFLIAALVLTVLYLLVKEHKQK